MFIWAPAWQTPVDRPCHDRLLHRVAEAYLGDGRVGPPFAELEWGNPSRVFHDAVELAPYCQTG